MSYETEERIANYLDIDSIEPPTDVDHSHAGERLDPWFGYIPEESIVTAIEAAVANPGERLIAFVLPGNVPDEDYRTFVEHQRRAAKAYVADRHDELKFSFRTRRVPYLGVGPTVRVFYVTVGKVKR